MLRRILDSREIDDLSDVVEERILEKLKANFRSQMEEVKANFVSKMMLIKSDMIAQIVNSLGGLPRSVGTNGGYEKFSKDFEVTIASGEDRVDCVERPIGTRVGQFARPRSQLKLKHKMEVSNFSSTLNPKDLIYWIGELEEYFDLEDIEDPLRVRLAQTKLKGNVAL